MSHELLIAKTEVTYGTAIATAAADVIWAMNVKHKLLGQKIEIDTARPSLGGAYKKTFGEHVEITFETLLSASGTAGTAPNWGKLAKGCAMGETVAAGASVTYARIVDPDSATSLTFTYRFQGRKHQAIGCRGKWDIKLVAGDVPKLMWTFRGILVPLVTSAYPAPADADFTGWAETDPIQFTTSTFTLGGVAQILRELSLSGGDNVKFINLPGQKGVFLRGQNVFTGSVKATQPAVGTYNPEAKWLSSSKEAFAFTHNTVAGSIVTVNGRLQLDEPDWSKEDEYDVFTSPVTAVGSTIGANDDLTIVLT